MKQNSYKWIASFLIATLTTSLYGCSDDDGYKGNLDLSLLCVTQAREAWNGAECNVTKTLNNDDTQLVFDLNVSLYQNRKAGSDVTVDLIVDQDSLTKTINRVDEGGIYEKYKNAVAFPADYYSLSDNKLTMKAGETKSEKITVTVNASKLLTDAVRNENENAFFALPLRIKNSTGHQINDKVDFLMLMVQLPQIDPTQPDPTEPKQKIEGMKLVWNDEFNGTGAPDTDKWSFETGFARNQELQWYQSNNAECVDGALVITGKKERVRNPNYQSGSSDWKKNREYAEYTSSSMTTSKSFNFKYGRMLVRAKIPTGMGAWPAIWTVGNWWEWPLGGEIDILEYYLVGGVPAIHANACWGSDTRWSGKWDSYNRPLSEFVAKDSQWKNKYHIWRMDWDEEYIRLYLDDELLNEIDLSTTRNGGGGESWLEGRYENPFSNSYSGFGQYILLNLAIGSNGGTPDADAFPMNYYVDYVRVYQYEE